MYRLVAEKGYDKTSIGQISEEIGIKKASIYYYFKSKEDIFIQLVKKLYEDDYSDKIGIFDQEVSKASYQKGLILLGEKFIDAYFENKNLRKVYAEIDIQTTRIPALKEFVRTSNESFKEMLTQGILQGVKVGAFPKEFDVTLNAQILYTLLMGIDQAILYDLPITPKEVWKESVWKLFDEKEKLKT